MVGFPTAANKILENKRIIVPLKYLIKYWWSLEMPLINCRVELKLKWIKLCVLAMCGNDDDTHSNNIVLLSKTQNFMSL